MQAKGAKNLSFKINDLEKIAKIFRAKGVRKLAKEKIHLYSSVFLQGGIAQLGERLHGMQEVSGSIPLTSTKNSQGPYRLEA